MYSKEPLEYEQNLKVGPSLKRGCTDVICAIIFIAYIVAMVIFAVIGFSKGNLTNIARPYDSAGNACGQGNALNFPFVYFPNLMLSKNSNSTVCVQSCPPINATQTNFKLNCLKNTFVKDCSQVHVIPSLALLTRICVPLSSSVSSTSDPQVSISRYQKVMHDIKVSWPIILAVLGISIVICIVYFYMIQCCAFFFIIASIIFSIVAMIVMGVFLWFRSETLKANGQDPSTVSYYKYGAIIFWVAGGICSLLCCLLCSRIRLAASMISAAADFISSKFSVILVPIITLCFMFVFSTLWLVAFLYIYSVGTVTWYPGNIFGDLVWSVQTEIAVYFMLFGLLWVLSYYIANKQHTIAVLACDWYFNRLNESTFSMFTAYWWGFWYHLGSLAFGSFLTALVWGVQLLMSYFHDHAKKANETSCVYRAARCFVDCFERFLMYVNKNAYIEVALRNLNYCSSIYKCVELFSSNSIRFTVLLGIIDIFMFFAGVIISTIVTIIGYYLLALFNNNTPDPTFGSIGPTIVFFLVAFLVTTLFNSVLETASDCMFHCFLYEETEAASLGGSNRYSPQKIKDIMDNARGTYSQLPN